DAVLHYPRDGISDHLVRPDRHADKGVNKVGITVREEYNRWLPDHRKHNRKDEECEHTRENTCASPAFKAPAYHALIASLDARPKAGLKTFDHALEIEMVQAIKAIEEYREVAYAKRSTRVRDERDCSKDYCRGFKPSRNLRPAAIRSVRLHEVGSKVRVDDIRHEQRSKERNDERHGQKVHELPDDARPEGKRNKRRKHYQRSRQYRQEDLASGNFCSLPNRHLPVGKNAVGVLDDHDSVVDNNAERQQEREQRHHVQREVEGREDQERYKAGYGHGQRHKHSVGCTHEEHENNRHERSEER